MATSPCQRPRCTFPQRPWTRAQCSVSKKAIVTFYSNTECVYSLGLSSPCQSSLLAAVAQMGCPTPAGRRWSGWPYGGWGSSSGRRPLGGVWWQAGPPARPRHTHPWKGSALCFEGPLPRPSLLGSPPPEPRGKTGKHDTDSTTRMICFYSQFNNTF